MNGWIVLGGNLVCLLLAGLVIGTACRQKFVISWLGISAALLALNDILLTGAHGLLPDLIGGEWIWQGKMVALIATLAIAASPAFGWNQCGLRLHQEPGSLQTAIPIAALYCLYIIGLALFFPNGSTNAEEVAFQLTMPGIEEEPFFRGILLLSLDKAFLARKRVLGVDWGWGAVVACLMFGLGHALDFSEGRFTVDILTLALSGLPSFVAVWLRLRTGSLLLPILLHNFGNTVTLFL